MMENKEKHNRWLCYEETCFIQNTMFSELIKVVFSTQKQIVNRLSLAVVLSAEGQ